MPSRLEVAVTRPKILLDENISPRVAVPLRSSGYDTVSVLEVSPGISDHQVMEQAIREQRLLVTLDRDFGTLIFRYSEHHIGVVYLRLRREITPIISKVLIDVLTHHSQRLVGNFSVVTETSIRIRSGGI